MTAIKSVPMTNRLDERSERESDVVTDETLSDAAVVA